MKTLARQAPSNQLAPFHRPGIRFSSRGGLRDAMRLCFAYYDEERLAEGVERLGRALAT